MKVGILTLPLHDNYGGILQSAALYRVLQNMGHDPVILSKKLWRPSHMRWAGKILRSLPGHDIKKSRSMERARARHYPFLDRFLPHRSAPLYSVDAMQSFVRRAGLDVVVVGSDQVWRPSYMGDADTASYFLGFPGSFRKVAYAASFGKSVWPQDERLPSVKRMLADFDDVSLREMSGVELCKDVLGREDCQMAIDPTLLVPTSFFSEAMAGCPSSSSRVLNYVLDDSPDVQAVVGKVLEHSGKQDGLKKVSLDDGGATLNIPAWLRAFHGAETVVTDSFHGTIFSILFEKPFVCVGNAERGLDRFESLLGLLGLEDRLVTSADDAEVIKQPIDFERVEQTLAHLRANSMKFLETALSPVEQIAKAS